MDNVFIIVAGHKDIDSEKLEAPYVEINRNSIDGIDGITSDLEKWSEYPAFFKSFPLKESVDTVGTMHYRCLFNLDPESNAVEQPFSNRYNFSKSQLDFIDLYKNQVVVGRPLDFSFANVSAFQQFSDCHPDSVAALEIACKEFDKITGLQSKRDLSNQGYLYARGMFLASSEFANNWYNVSYQVAKNLDSFNIQSRDDRWGGYILERLFSVYAQQYNLVQRPLMYFLEGR